MHGLYQPYACAIRQLVYPRSLEPNALMESNFSCIETNHNGLIHDVQPDFFGKWLATCSSDNSIHIYDMKNPEKTKPIAILSGHEGPVYKLCWAHPCFGNVLASCSYDKKVIVWKEHLGTWTNVYTYEGHSDSVTTLAWSPQEHDLNLLCGSIDGCISLVYQIHNEWNSVKKVVAHQIGVTGVSWGPPYIWEDDECTRVQQFVSCGMDGAIKLWILEDKKLIVQKKLESHMDSVRCIAWAPDIGTNDMIASGSQDGSLIVWNKLSNGNWDAQLLHKFNESVYSVSWSTNARTLAVSSGANNVSLWKRKMDNTWICVSKTNVGGDNSGIAEQAAAVQPSIPSQAKQIESEQTTNQFTHVLGSTPHVTPK